MYMCMSKYLYNNEGFVSCSNKKKEFLWFDASDRVYRATSIYLSELAGTRKKVWIIKSSDNRGCLLTYAFGCTIYTLYMYMHIFVM